MTIQTINPATEEIIQTYTEMDEKTVRAIIDETHQDFLKWKRVPFENRALHMRKMKDLLLMNKGSLAEIMSKEMGKPIHLGIAEIEKCALVCEHYAENASTYLKSRLIKTEMQKSYVTYKPLGIVFAIMPWNFPFWQVYRFAAPTIMAGNAALLKHAPISTGTSLSIEALFREAGFPQNLFRSLILSNAGAAKVIENQKIRAVTLTGSGRAGQSVGETAGKVLKPVVLELGGSDPYLILEDADLELAANACVTSRLNNSGQVCIAAKRIIALRSVYEQLLALIKEKIKDYKMGDPMDESCNFGPLARQDIRDGVHEQVQKSIQQGAKLIAGGQIPNRKGFYYPPTILSEVRPGMVAFDEEIFGPVISLISADSEEEAIKLANNTPYGLAAGIFTRDTLRGERIAVEEIDAGTCAVNTFVASDPRLPFGGIKDSGYGRELSQEGIHAFVNTKTINIK